MPDLIRLVHGNPHSFVKLIREFREFWRLKMGGQPLKEKNGETSENAAESDNVPNDLNVSATSVDELPCTPTSCVDKDCASPKEEHQISKRQLEMEIRNMAVYEKREGLKRSHWFVNKDVLEKHNMTDLPIPCKWDYIVIKPTVKKEKSDKLNVSSTPSTPATPKTPGRVTPSITQFTVGVSPSQIESMLDTIPKPSPIVSTPISSKTAHNVKKDVQLIKLTPKSGTKSIADFVKPVQPNQLFAVNNKLPSKDVNVSQVLPVAMDTDDKYQVAESSTIVCKPNTNTSVSLEVPEDDDCMIIE